MTLTVLFPWSSEARIIEFLIDSWHENSEQYFTSRQIADGSEVHPRTVRVTIWKLARLKIVQIYQFKSHVRARGEFTPSRISTKFRMQFNDLTKCLLKTHIAIINAN